MYICCGDPVSRASVWWSDKSKALSEIKYLCRRRCGEFTYVTYYCCVVWYQNYNISWDWRARTVQCVRWISLRQTEDFLCVICFECAPFRIHNHSIAYNCYTNDLERRGGINLKTLNSRWNNLVNTVFHWRLPSQSSFCVSALS